MNSNDFDRKTSERSSRRAVALRGLVDAGQQQVAVVVGDRRSAGGGRRVKVLDEEAYIKNLEKIIERDFFPDLERLKLKSRYLDALKHNDYDSAKSIYSQLLAARSSAATPTPLTKEAEMEALLERKRKLTATTQAAAAEETPYANQEPPDGFEDDRLSTVSGGGGVGLVVKKRLPNLDGFLAQTTSEDNVSFDDLMSEARKKEALKTHHTWLHDKELQHRIKHGELLKLENGDGVQSSMTTSQLAIQPVDTWTYTSKNTLMYVPDGVKLTDEEERERHRKARLINHSNTRFNDSAALTVSTTTAAATLSDDVFKKPMMPLITAVPKVGIDGKELKKATPNIRGYGFVDASPSPMPGGMAGDESPMMTWGEIESTPFRLDPSASPLISSSSSSSLPEFKIAELSDRERLALDLEEKANAARRKKKQEALAQVQKSLAPSPSPRSTPSPFVAGRTPQTQSVTEKIVGMSPAAQRLLSKNIKAAAATGNSPAAAVRSSIFLRSSTNSSRDTNLSSPSVATPSSSSSMDKLRSNLVRPTSAAGKSTGPATPSQHSSTVKSSANKTPIDQQPSSLTSLTDNLLKLPNQ